MRPRELLSSRRLRRAAVHQDAAEASSSLRLPEVSSQALRLKVSLPEERLSTARLMLRAVCPWV